MGEFYAIFMLTSLPNGPGYGVVTDCLPHGSAIEETVAKARIIDTVPNLIAALEAWVAEFRSNSATNGKARIPEACAQAIAALGPRLRTCLGSGQR